MARKNAYSSWLTAVKKALIPTSKNSGKKPQIDEETSKKRDRRRWSFRKSQSRQQQVQVNPPSPEKMAAEEAEVATTTAVRLTKPSAFKPREYYAAVIIQTVFRGYLARRALRALKGLVKLQALVRGRNVRRKTNTILQSMKAFVRVQDKFSDDRRIRHFPSPVPAPFNGHKSSLSCADNFWDPRFMNRRSDCNLYHKEEEEPPEMTWLDQWMASRTSISNRNRGSVTTDLPFSDTTPLRRPCYNNHHLPSSPTTPKTPSTPNYMTATESAMARLRSRSVQRQSPERERAPAARKRLSFPAPEPHSRNRVWSPRYGMMTRQMSNVSSSVTESFGGEISPASTADLRRWLR